MIKKFTSYITRTHDRAIPTVILVKYNIILPDHIKTFIKLRNKFTKNWQRPRLDVSYQNNYYFLQRKIE